VIFNKAAMESFFDSGDQPMENQNHAKILT
jgi:hypothetical protein